MALKRLPVPPEPWTFLLPSLFRLCSVLACPLLPCKLPVAIRPPIKDLCLCLLSGSQLHLLLSLLISPGEFSTWMAWWKGMTALASVKGARTFSTAISAWPAADRVTLLACHTCCPGPLILKEWPKDLPRSIKARGAHSFWVISAGSHILHLHSSAFYFSKSGHVSLLTFLGVLISFPHFPLFLFWDS